MDVLGFVPVPEAAAEALAAAVEGAAAAEAALVAKLEALQVAAGEGATATATAGPEAAAPTAPSAAELRDARALLRQYVGAHSMWEGLRAAARTAAGHSPDTRSKRRKLEVGAAVGLLPGLPGGARDAAACARCMGGCSLLLARHHA